MTNPIRLRTPPAASAPVTLQPAASAPTRTRVDGWTPTRQKAFIETLADCGSVALAARAVGCSKETAYRLRRKPGAEAFAQAWDAAIAHAIRRLSDEAVERALLGEEVPVFYKGELVGTRRRYSDRLITFLLRHHDPAAYGVPYDYNFVNPKDRLGRKAKTLETHLDKLTDWGDEGDGDDAHVSDLK